MFSLCYLGELSLKPLVVNSRNVTVSVCRVKCLLFCSGEVLSMFRESGLSLVSHCRLGQDVQTKALCPAFLLSQCYENYYIRSTQCVCLDSIKSRLNFKLSLSVEHYTPWKCN